MTILVVLLLGAGIVLIASSLECQPITSTFQKILSGDTIDWSGQANCGSGTGQNLQPGQKEQPTGCKNNPQAHISDNAPANVQPDKSGCCPDGYNLYQVGVGAAVCLRTYA